MDVQKESLSPRMLAPAILFLAASMQLVAAKASDPDSKPVVVHISPTNMPEKPASDADPKNRWIFISKLPLDGKPVPKAGGSGNRWFASPSFGDPVALNDRDDPDTYRIDGLQVYDPNREFWTTNDTVVIGYVVEAKEPCPSTNGDLKLDFGETARSSAFVEGLEALAGGGKAKPAEKNKGEFNTPIPRVVDCMYVKTYVLQDDRATLTIKATPGKQAGEDLTASSATILTGSDEHLFFTADAAVTHISDLNYDPKTGSVTEKSRPTNLLVGLNYLVGDPYRHYPGFGDWDKVAFKVFAQPTTPWKAFGVGVGYVIGADALGTSKDSAGALMVFGGYERTVSDTGIHNGTWIIGVSFNINYLNSGK